MDNAKKIANLISVKIGKRHLDEDDIDEYGLNKETHKPYYAFCYWENGSNGSFCDKSDLEELFNDKLRHSYNENYNIIVYDVKTQKELLLETKVSIKLWKDE